MKIDKKLIKELVDHLSEFNLTEIEYQEGQTKITVSKASKAFEKVKLPYDRTEKGAPSFTKNFLATHPAELPKLINEAREINKANTTFIDTILKHEHNGRIHAEINQIRSDQGGAVTGRFSSNSPNLQQIPARPKELGPMIRSLFIPEDKCTWR